MNEKTPLAVFTVGHSTRTLEAFLELLSTHKVSLLIDVRTVPRSRRNPQFNRETLPDSLQSAGVDYEHMGGLGGFRRSGADSPNQGWRNMSFRGYADYMQTDEFAENLAMFLKRAASQRAALMCAEAVPWRCHRSLIADALLVRGIVAEEIISGKRTQPHKLTSFAKVEGETITYPPEEQEVSHLTQSTQSAQR